MFVLKIRQKRRAFKVLKPGKTCLRSGFSVGPGERRDGILKTAFNLFFLTISFLGGRTNLQVPPAAACLGVAGLLHARTLLTMTRSGLLLVGASCGRGETVLDGFVHDLPNSLVDGATGSVLGDMDIVGAAAQRGETALGGYSMEFEKSVYTRPAESSCMKRFVGVNSFNSLICHPSMHAPSLARVFDGKSGGVSGMVCCEGVGGRVKREGHCTFGGTLHVWMRCCMM